MEKYRYTINRYDFETKQHFTETKTTTNSYQRTFETYKGIVKDNDNCSLELVVQPMTTEEILLAIKVVKIKRKKCWVSHAYNPKYLISNGSILELDREN